METHLPKDLLATEKGQVANQILRSCVHCGFCLSACPTYGILGDELDSPRGRIYLIKQALEGKPVSANTLSHLDRCLTCRSCETTCPSGVEYGHLLDIGRETIEERAPRQWHERFIRESLRRFLVTPWIFNLSATIAPWVKHETLNKRLQSWVKAQSAQTTEPLSKKVLLISGCVQPALAPNINLATKGVLNALGYQVVETPQSECCGAVSHHLSAEKATFKQIAHNINQWHAQLEQGAEVIISNASGCGVMIKDYAHYIKTHHYEEALHQKALKIVEKTVDIGEFMLSLPAKSLTAFRAQNEMPIVFHAPCTLQHGQRLKGAVESLLASLGYHVPPVADAHLCCGSAGTYSIFQKELSNQLKENKVKNLEQTQPKVILTANIGCLLQLQSGTETPVKHWVQYLAEQAMAHPVQNDCAPAPSHSQHI